MKKFVIVGIGLCVLGAGVYLAVNATSNQKVGQMVSYNDTALESSSMGDGMDHSTMNHTSKTSEKAFLEHMIPHHKEAVDTAKEVIARGGTLPEIKTLANAIISTQEAEITSMKAWYKSWYNADFTLSESYTPMMRDLSELSGADLDKAFLTDMIEHHMMALTQGQAVASQTTRPEIIKLATDIAETQSNEIITMRILLKQLPE